MTKIVMLHYVKLVFRTVLFVAALCVYLYNKIAAGGENTGGFYTNRVLLGIIWLIFFIEMLLRFFPSKAESMGCQKQFARNYRKADSTDKRIKLNTAKTTFAVAACWSVLNIIIGAAYLKGLLDGGIMLLIALFYSVCDIICILFFCPFQTWIMKNKCCGTCRIYNWDYAMMFTPFVFVENAYARSLLAAALILLIRWEITVRRHPERFTQMTNKSLTCAMCEEKLCHHKKQLQGFLKKNHFR